MNVQLFECLCQLEDTCIVDPWSVVTSVFIVYYIVDNYTVIIYYTVAVLYYSIFTVGS